MGRSGKLFAHEWAGVTPDVMCIAKGLGGGFPVGAFMATNKAAVGMTAGTHGSTFGGNPLAVCAANAVLDVLLEPGFLDNVVVMGNHLTKALNTVAAAHPNVIELVRDKSSRERLAPESAAAVFCRDTAITQGLMVRQTGDAMIMAPPFVTERSEIDFLVDQLAIALDKTAEHYGVTGTAA